VIEVVGVDVGDERDGGVVELEGAVGLVGLDDEELVRSAAAGCSELGDHAAVDEAGVIAERLQRGDDHARRRGLAVRSGDRHQPAPADEPVQRLRAVDDRHPALLGRDELGVLGPDRPGVDDGVGVAEVARVVTGVHARSEAGEILQGGAVGPV
jgi:hypothetical protein